MLVKSGYVIVVRNKSTNSIFYLNARSGSKHYQWCVADIYYATIFTSYDLAKDHLDMIDKYKLKYFDEYVPEIRFFEVILK